MIYECEVLNDVALKKINALFDEGVFRPGTINKKDKQLVEPDRKKTKVLDQNTSQFRKSLELVQDGLTSSAEFKSTYMFREMTVPIFSEYDEGCHYETHVDNVTIQGLKTHHSITLFLSDPDEYEGGSIVLTPGDSEFSYKCKAGTALIYPTGFTHCVEPITSGKRRVALMWSTSLIDDFFMRHQILNFGKGIQKLMNHYRKTYNQEVPNEVLIPFEQVRTNFIREYGNL